MPETEWQKKEDERFDKNSHIVREILDLFGLKLIAFNHDWVIEQMYPRPGSSTAISDDPEGWGTDKTVGSYSSPVKAG